MHGFRIREPAAGGGYVSGTGWWLLLRARAVVVIHVHLSSFALMARASHSDPHSAHRPGPPSESKAADKSVRATRAIAIDTGGTFTDCVWAEGGALKTLKVF